MRKLFAFLMCCGISTGALAQNVPISYQGALEFSGSPYTGVVDMTFRFYDAPTGGSQVGLAETVSGVAVQDGLFQVDLEFDVATFESAPFNLYLEAEVEGTALTPRQQVAHAPIAAYALEHAGAEPLWQLNGSSAYYDSGSVGIGTDSPSALLQVQGLSSIGTPHLRVTAGEDDYARFTFDNNQGTGRFWTLAGLTRGGDATLDRLNLFSSAAGDVMSLTGNGRVGIGTLNPQSTFDVNGSVRVRGMSHADSSPRHVRVTAAGDLASVSATVHLGISPTDFVPASVKDTTIGYFMANSSFYGHDGTAFRMFASLSALPDGATLNELRVWYVDNSGTDNLEVKIERCPHGSYACEDVATLASSGTNSSMRQMTRTTFTPAVIDHANYNYQLTMRALTFWDGSNLSLNSMRISYVRP